MTKTLITRVSQLIQPSSYWMSENSITLKDGEIGVDKDLGIYKIGDGVSKWKDLPVFFTGLKLDGSTVLNGGATSYDGGDLPVTVVLSNETSVKNIEGYVPLKGEPVTELTDTGLQGVKIGDGQKTFGELAYVTPYDDIIFDTYSTVEDFNV